MAALLHVERGSAAVRAPLHCCAAETLKKTALSQHHIAKKRLRKCAHVLFSAPILFARRADNRVFQTKFFEE